LFIVPVGGLATVVPLPGGIGGVEFAVAGMVIALTTIDPAVVGAMVLLYRVCVYWFLVLVGGASLFLAATSFSRLAAGASEDPDLADGVSL
jgi:uncharacterized membrane protein YbhN (UPF0104 family)